MCWKLELGTAMCSKVFSTMPGHQLAEARRLSLFVTVKNASCLPNVSWEQKSLLIETHCAKYPNINQLIKCAYYYHNANLACLK